MDRYLVCQICGEKLSFNPFCTCSLGEHLIKKHPNVEMTHFVVDDLSFCECDKETASGSAQGAESDANSSPGSITGKTGISNKSGVFKTTVETWKPGPLKVTCPQCGKEDRPCIRKQRNKVAYSQLGAMCMISCWPICFLPFLMPQASDIHLYCRHCGAFIGEYNRKTGTLKSSPSDGNKKINVKKINVPSNLC